MINVGAVLETRHHTNRHLNWIGSKDGAQCGSLLDDSDVGVPCPVCGVPSIQVDNPMLVTLVKRTLPMCYLSDGHPGDHEGCGPAMGLDSVVTWNDEVPARAA